MRIVAAKCTNCGGVLEVDSEKDAAVCKYCNTPFIVEKAIENYNITNNYTTVNNTINNISGQEVHIHQNGETPELLLENIKTLLKRNEKDLAQKTYETLKEKYPADYRVDEATICFDLHAIHKLYFKQHIYGFEKVQKNFENLKESNHAVYAVYYEQFVNMVNKELLQITKKTFRKDLPFTKLAVLWNICGVSAYGFREGLLQDGLKSCLGFHINIPSNNWEAPTQFLSYQCTTQHVLKAIKSDWGNGDDDFLLYLLTEIEAVLDWSKKWYPYDRTPLNRYEEAMKNDRNSLVNYLSPEAKNKYEREKNRQQIRKFWTTYGDLMRDKQIKTAYKYLLQNTAIKGASKELAKFKKGIFGVKYLGDVNALNADDLINATLAAEGLK